MQALGYRAPEVFLGLPMNMWALGCLLSALYLGMLLHSTSSSLDVMRAIVQPPYELLDKLAFIQNRTSPRNAPILHGS